MHKRAATSFSVCVDTHVSTSESPLTLNHVQITKILVAGIILVFWATVCKTVRPMPSDRCPVCLSVCLKRWCTVAKRLDESRCHLVGGRPRPRQLCVRWGPRSPSPKGGGTFHQFSTHAYCGQTAGWIKMALDTEVNLSPGDFVLDGDPAPPQKGGGAPPQFRPISVAKRLDGSRCHLVQR